MGVVQKMYGAKNNMIGCVCFLNVMVVKIVGHELRDMHVFISSSKWFRGILWFGAASKQVLKPI